MNSFANSNVATALLLMMHCGNILALPDDSEQRLDIDASNSEIFLDEGRTVHYGQPGNPVVITQGSLRVEGDVIEQLSSDGEPTRLIATGNPARFQQQPEIDGGILYGSARTLTFDEGKNLAVLEDNASLSQDGTTLAGYYLDYDTVVRQGNARGVDADDLVQIELVQNGETSLGTANTAHFDDIAGIVILESNAHLKHLDSEFSGHIVKYDLNSRRVSVNRREDDLTDRINISINPGDTE